MFLLVRSRSQAKTPDTICWKKSLMCREGALHLKNTHKRGTSPLTPLPLSPHGGHGRGHDAFAVAISVGAVSGDVGQAVLHTRRRKTRRLGIWELSRSSVMLVASFLSSNVPIPSPYLFDVELLTSCRPLFGYTLLYTLFRHEKATESFLRSSWNKGRRVLGGELWRDVPPKKTGP